MGGGEGSQDGCHGRSQCLASPGLTCPRQALATCTSSLGLTFILGSEFAHLSWKSLVELVLPRDQGLAQSCLVEVEHTGMPPNLVDKGLQQDALGSGLHLHGPEGWAHPPSTGGREKGEVAGSSSQRVLRVSSVPASVCLASTPRSHRSGRSARSKQ